MIDNCNKVHGLMEEQLQDFFKPASWNLKFDFINHLVLFNNVIMAVVDEEGGGKTTFCKLLLNSLNEQIKVAFFPGLSTTFTKNDLLAQMSDIVEQPIDALSSFENMVELVNKLGVHHLIVIDNANTLSQDFVMQLLRAVKSQKDSVFFHVCLAGDHGLARTLRAMECSDEFRDYIHAFEPGTLKPSEVKTYVRRKLMMAPNGGKDVLADEVRFESFYKLTLGHMSKINKNLDFFKAKNNYSFKMMLAASIVFVSCGSAYLLLKHNNTNQVIEQDSVAGHLAKNFENNHSNIQLASLPIDNAHTMQMDLSSGHRLPASFDLEEHEREDIAETANDVSLSEALMRPNQLVQTVAVTKGRQLAAQSGILDFEHQPVIVAASAKSHAVFEESIASNAYKPSHANKTTNLERNKIIQHGSAMGYIVQRANRQNAYTIQLVASRKREEIERFMMEHHLQNDVAMKLSQRDGERWYVLTYGQYLSARQAALAMRKLPKDTANMSPWVRKARELVAVG